MTTLLTNGATIVQGEFDLDLGDRFVEAGGERIPLLAALESLLFVAAEPVEPTQLARTLELDVATVEKTIRTLAHRYSTTGRGLRLQERDGKFQLVTLPAAAPWSRPF